MGWIIPETGRAIILKDSYFDGSGACFSAIKVEIDQMPYAFPLVNQALYKRARRWGSIISELLLKKDAV